MARSTTEDLVVQPGTCIRSNPDDPNNGTANFLFTSSEFAGSEAADQRGGQRANPNASETAYYIGTAGHTAPGPRGKPVVWQHGSGPSAYECHSGQRIGEWVYRVFDSPFVLKNDFGLIRIDDGVDVDAAVKHWGGPTAYFDGTTNSPTTVYQYGDPVIGLYDPSDYNQRVPERARARVGLATELSDPHNFGYKGFAWAGDSGSPVLTSDGRALGLQVAILPGTPVVGAGREHDDTVFGVRLKPMVELAEETLGIQLVLQTAPLN